MHEGPLLSNPESDGMQRDFDFPQGLGSFIDADTVRFFRPDPMGCDT